MSSAHGFPRRFAPKKGDFFGDCMGKTRLLNVKWIVISNDFVKFIQFCAGFLYSFAVVLRKEDVD